jgi:hypothetical protein
VTLRKTRKAELLNAMGNDWLCASDIANLANVQHKSAIKLLLNMALNGEIEVHTHEWIDERCRHRRKSMYRKPSITDSERASLLNSCFGLRVVQPAGLINARVHVLKV